MRQRAASGGARVPDGQDDEDRRQLVHLQVSSFREVLRLTCLFYDN